MDLYLMQHGEAKAEAEDPARPLTDAGAAAVKRVVGRAEAAGVQIDRCVHSGKLRAEQTAHLLAREIAANSPVEAREGLAPNDPVAPVAQWLSELTENRSIVLVGHLPFLDRLASLLVADDEGAQAIRFQMGGLVKLVPKQEGAGFAVAWMLPPEIA
jgi:phosphohistidine phosphatase